MRTARQKVDVELKDARVGWGVEGVKNANPSSESVSKMRTLKQKIKFEASKTHTLHQKVCRKCDPSCRKCVFDCLTASFGEHFGVPKIAPLSVK